MQATRSACALWANSVMPALFPYLVLSQLLASFLHNDILTIPLSMLGGSPAGARLISFSQVSKNKAQRLAALCATASPLYILGTLQGGFRMLLAHWLGALAPWICIRILQGRSTQDEPQTCTESIKNRIIIPQAIADAAIAMLSVCGCMVMFSVLSALFLCAIPMATWISTLLMCVLEMAGGCASILSLGLQEAQTAPLLCAAVSFGGLSIFMQNATFFKKTGVSLRTQFLARILHACAAYGLCRLFYLS